MKRTFSAKEILADISSGMTKFEVMAKYGLKPSEFRQVLAKMQKAGRLDISTLPDEYKDITQHIEKGTWCPMCKAMVVSGAKECPTCGVVFAKRAPMDAPGQAGPYPEGSGSAHNGEKAGNKKRHIGAITIAACVALAGLAYEKFPLGSALKWLTDRGITYHESISGPKMTSAIAPFLNRILQMKHLYGVPLDNTGVPMGSRRDWKEVRVPFQETMKQFSWAKWLSGQSGAMIRDLERYLLIMETCEYSYYERSNNPPALWNVPMRGPHVKSAKDLREAGSAEGIMWAIKLDMDLLVRQLLQMAQDSPKTGGKDSQPGNTDSRSTRRQQ